MTIRSYDFNLVGIKIIGLDELYSLTMKILNDHRENKIPADNSQSEFLINKERRFGKLNIGYIKKKYLLQLGRNLKPDSHWKRLKGRDWIAILWLSLILILLPCKRILLIFKATSGELRCNGDRETEVTGVDKRGHNLLQKVPMNICFYKKSNSGITGRHHFQSVTEETIKILKKKDID